MAPALVHRTFDSANLQESTTPCSIHQCFGEFTPHQLSLSRLRKIVSEKHHLYSALQAQTSPGIQTRDQRILLEKVADSARKAVKLAEPYKPYGGRFLEFCSIALSTYQTCVKLTRKSTEFCQFFCRQNLPDPNTNSQRHSADHYSN